jgi:alpha-tubulin suppressor-like RCC1 family protein
VIAWGRNDYQQTNVPPDLTNAVAVSGGGYHSLALRRDGMVTAWGDNTYGQCTVPSAATNIIAVAAGGTHSLALRADRKVIAWGENDFGQTTVPATLSNVVAIAAGDAHSLALVDSAIAPAFVLSAVSAGTNTFSLTTTTTIGRSFYVEYCDTIPVSNWTLLPPLAGDGALKTITHTNAPVERRLYRAFQCQ